MNLHRLLVLVVLLGLVVPSAGVAKLLYPNPMPLAEVDGDPDEPDPFADRDGPSSELDPEATKAGSGESDLLLAFRLVLQLAGGVVLP
jgi:energy-converting hydrogenase Eha subunit F